MNGDPGKKRWVILLLGLLAAVAIGTVAYQVGVSHGLSLQPPVAATPPAAGGAPAAPPPYPYYPYHFYGPWRFGFFGPLLFILFWIVVFRAVMWGVFGWRRHSWRDPAYWPDRFDDWHRRAHERMRGDATTTPPAAS
jgi:hypothetical protein